MVAEQGRRVGGGGARKGTRGRGGRAHFDESSDNAGADTDAVGRSHLRMCVSSTL